MPLGRILLWLLVVVLGIEIGAGIYEARVLVPLWSSAPPESLVAYNLASVRPNPGLSFWIVSTPLVGLLALANLVAAWRYAGRVRRWWLGGAGATVVIVAATFIYFVPELQAFEALRDVGTAEVASRVHRWVALNWVRAIIYIGAWLSLLHAYAHGAEQQHAADGTARRR